MSDVDMKKQDFISFWNNQLFIRNPLKLIRQLPTHFSLIAENVLDV